MGSIGKNKIIDGMRMCCKCGGVFSCSKHPTTRWRFYVDDCGRYWRGKWCPDCANGRLTKYRRKKRIHMAYGKRGTQIKARESETRVAKRLVELGFSNVKLNPKIHGPDITFNSHGTNVTMEVKTVVKGSNGAGYSCRVHEKRKSDDFIAHVFPLKILFETMKSHLRKCTPIGRRCFSRKTMCGINQ